MCRVLRIPCVSAGARCLSTVGGTVGGGRVDGGPGWGRARGGPREAHKGLAMSRREMFHAFSILRHRLSRTRGPAMAATTNSSCIDFDEYEQLWGFQWSPQAELADAQSSFGWVHKCTSLLSHLHSTARKWLNSMACLYPPPQHQACPDARVGQTLLSGSKGPASSGR